jgi:hypothetical protein
MPALWSCDHGGRGADDIPCCHLPTTHHVAT